MANTIVFQGVEIFIPAEVAFVHKNGCLEIDLSTGISGKLLLKRGQLPNVQAPALQPLLGHLTPATANVIYDTLEPLHEGGIFDGQAGTSTRAFWFNSSPRETQEAPATLESPEQPVVPAQDLALPDRLPAASHSTEENAAPAATAYHVPVTAAAAEPAEAGAARPETQAAVDVSGSPAADTGKPSDSPSDEPQPQSSADADKENEGCITPGPQLHSSGKVSTGKRSTEGDKSWSKSAKRMKALLQTESPSKEFMFRWKPLETVKGAGTEETAPAARWGASFTALSDTKGCLYGGASEDGPLGDAWLFDSERLAWEQTANSGFGGFPGAAKAWHTAAVLDYTEGRQLLVYGGERSSSAARADGAEPDEDDDECEPIADVCTLDALAHFWVTLPMDGTGGGDAIPARAGATMTALPDGRGFVFGGLDIEGKYRNDAFVVDAKRISWFSLAGIMKGAPPKPRAYHSATLVGQRIIIIGGLGSRVWSCKEVYSVQLGSWKWAEHTSEVEGEVPTPRSGHTAVALPDGRHLALFGGGDADRDLFYSSVSVLDTATWRWSTPKIQGVARPSGRGGHASALLRLGSGRSALVVHGGRTSGDKLLKDTWMLELHA
ncbi:probable acyl-CoA-binding domain-containing protein 5 at C-terminar half [Coccomyxa sp. Obi]|nr:probable acyl-CoA-binding domain-containing protein 5 at C-terminar half [Coccomyxa sp. Obi]